jgi:hypothetical protein
MNITGNWTIALTRYLHETIFVYLTNRRAKSQLPIRAISFAGDTVSFVSLEILLAVGFQIPGQKEPTKSRESFHRSGGIVSLILHIARYIFEDHERTPI